MSLQRALAGQLTVALLAAIPAWSRRLRCLPRLPSQPAGCWSADSAPRPSWRDATAAAVGAARWLCSAVCEGGHGELSLLKRLVPAAKTTQMFGAAEQLYAAGVGDQATLTVAVIKRRWPWQQRAGCVALYSCICLELAHVKRSFAMATDPRRRPCSPSIECCATGVQSIVRR